MAIESHLDKFHWVPGIGDPTFIGWFTVAVYFLAVIICFKASLITKTNNSAKTFWLFLALILIVLGINKQLDLQTLFTLIGKNIAIEQGWYKDRRIIQVGFIIFIGFLGVIGLSTLLIKNKSACAEIKTALFGCVILFTFIIIRAASFHHMDVFINMKLIGITVNGVLELGSLIIICTAGFKYIMRNKTHINN